MLFYIYCILYNYFIHDKDINRTVLYENKHVVEQHLFIEKLYKKYKKLNLLL